MLHNDAFAENYAVCRIGFFGMIRVHGVRVVGRNHKRRRQGRVKVHAQRAGDSFKRAFQKSSARALLGGRADFFVVGQKAYRKSVRGRVYDGFRRGKRRSEVVKTRRNQKFAFFSGQKRFFVRNHEEVFVQPVFFNNAFARPEADDRHKVDLRIYRKRGVCLAVKVNCHRRHDKAMFRLKKLHPKLVAVLFDVASGKLKRSVEPGVPKASAVSFDVQFSDAAGRYFGILFHLQTRAVGVRGDDIKAAGAARREGDDGRAVSHRKILFVSL